MIFVTVGTHEQPFDRLVKKIDELVRDGYINEKVFVQIGYSLYEPKYCEWTKFLGYSEMEAFIEKATVVITHGGPSTYMQVLHKGKIPIVVPREQKYNEHVNDHQVWVSKQVSGKGYPLFICEDVDELLLNIQKSRKTKNITNVSYNKEFIRKFMTEVRSII